MGIGVGWGAWAVAAFADEGMWRADQLPALAPRVAEAHPGVDLAPLASLEQGPLAAVVELPGCSGAFVSDTGLVATAYHCVWDALRYASRDGENLVETGFASGSQEGERWAGPAMVVRRTLGSTDVTAAVLDRTADLTGKARADRVEKNVRALVAKCEDAGDVVCEVQALDGGLQYRLDRMRVWRDVRLVYAPPRSVGFFGGRADNWAWPRQAGDFAFLRVYAAADGRPAAHAAANVPVRPEVALTPARGPAPGAFVLTAGFPGTTRRWLPAAEFEYTVEAQLPAQVRTYGDLTAVVRDVVAARPELGAKAQTAWLTLDNRYIYLEGNVDQLARHDAVARKWAVDRELEAWVRAEPARAARWGDVFDEMRGLAARQAATAERDVVTAQLLRRPELLHLATRLYTHARESRKPDAQRLAGHQDRDRADFVASVDEFDARFEPAVDAPVLRYLLLRALTLPDDQRIPEIDVWFGGLPHAGSLEQRLDAEITRLYASSATLRAAAARRALVDATPFKLESGGDPWFALAAHLQPLVDRHRDASEATESEWARLRTRYVEALQAWRADGDALPFYSDGNGTLRVSYGVVEGYEPADGLRAEPLSTVRGLARKAGPSPYDAPADLLAAIPASHASAWAEPAVAAVPVDFLSSCDTTAGNSGSPTFLADGRWVGLLFDGNAESMATDWVFEESDTRSIHTDANFVFWYLEDVAKASWLVTELDPTGKAASR